MAEPLLRKTFSRLRGREKLPRKKSDAKERGPRAPGSGEPAGAIWYNPIPEDDPRPRAPETPSPGPGPSPSPGPSLSAPSPPGAAPGSPPGKASRAKSPGPARRLSLKMKKLPELRRRLSLRSSRTGRERERAAPAGSVISRYHLDSSVGPAGRAAGSPQAGHRSDGDSPERPAGPPPPAAFRPYEAGPAARAPPAALWGRLSLHLCGLGGLRPAPGAAARDLCCLLQVDGVARARTGPLRAGPGFLRLDHTFHLELEAARLLRALVLAWDPGVRRHRPCAQGAVLLPALFRGCQAQQLAVNLEPQGLLYAKLTLSEQREAPGTAEPRVFGLPLPLLVEREQPPGQVPLIIQKCVAQIERRGLRVVGLYRLCGSAAVKKELRDAFERDSAAVCLSEDLYPDINVITGILKDYLRELPTPLITQPLYQVVLEAMARGPASRAASSTEGTRELLSCLPDVERATLTLLLDHLRLVSSFHAHNRMTPQNLAVCFGPVLLPARQASARPRTRSSGPGLANAVDFKRHIEVLHYLLQAWPDPRRPAEAPDPAPCLRPRRQSPLDLPLAAPAVVTRQRERGGPESPPSNRYAGDWSVCGRDLLSGPDYGHAPGSDSDSDEDEDGEGAGGRRGAARSDDDEDAFEAPFNPHLNLKDFDALILDLERELSKQIHVCL
ncbi:rho GTPase-activating protein SYDE1 isoform X2 [Suncus etruscus]|uniref:rho GTPase-activating protein SYDE1 isoform X2 n=1 Tax=Suncus etruscus TaxID=109475 RepID=UPI00210FF724|nr:rho GTPase-activating protein SYDE1 isoform X2 [Suncus etruscus]